jgi:hypothetical protein
MQILESEISNSISEDETALNFPGKKIGQVVTVKSKSNLITAHQWDGSAWCKIGDVINNPGSQKVEFKGKSYDYVFDVELDTSKNTFKLPYNHSDNPYETASKFIADNNLSIDVMDQIVDFLLKNTTPQTLERAEHKLFNPYEQTELMSKKSEHDELPVLKDINYEGLIKKLIDFNEKESNVKIESTYISNLRLSLQKGISINTDQLLNAINGWNATHLFPVIDALRVIVLFEDVNVCKVISAIVKRFPEFNSIGPAVLTFSRLLINAISSSQVIEYIFDISKVIDEVIEKCYSFPISDLMAPASLVKG